MFLPNQPETERLALLFEEMAEAIQVIGKIQRHGFSSTHPEGGPSNRKLLEKELGDVLVAIDLALAAGDVAWSVIAERIPTKVEKLRYFTHFQPAALLDSIYTHDSDRSS